MERLQAYGRRELVYVALGAMDMCVVTPLLVALFFQSAPIRPFPITVAFLAVVMIVHYLARLTLRLPLQPAVRSALLGLGMLVSGLLLIRRTFHSHVQPLDGQWLTDVFVNLRLGTAQYEVFTFLVVLFLWWRGLVLAQRQLDSSSVAYRFRVGLLLMMGTVALSSSIRSWSYHPFVYSFFFASLLGIALARVEEVGQQYGGSQSPFGLSWLATLVVAALAVLLPAAGLALVLTGENLQLLLVPVLQVLSIVLYYLVFGLAWLMQIVLAVLMLFFWQQWVQTSLEGLERFTSEDMPTLGQGEPGELPLSPEQMATFKAVGVVLGVLLLLVLAVISLRRLRAQAARKPGEERESVWQEINLRRSLRDLLRDGRRRLGEIADGLGQSPLGRMFAVLTIRRIYAHLSGLAAERGHPRAINQTPYEFQPTLGMAFPGCREEVRRITEAYVAVHYGEVPERPEELRAIRAAWDRVREAAPPRETDSP
jgi:hypothetical protein